ncbi:hypothetical protein EDEG_03524 [Edhazardia aedis USNM 41457]|uniref:Uncharacterized protein n=1 Tax=Edhazardia aedis (strain USNM 41457) TaxID=1003232 RepID=J9DKX1_EDHAE|nr:hypothetical protein EDEG_03524 [Edhazardia aedis USNM 41457]|eukprot:EJW02027.1 hypothetical protein EDEG_03524 [Edhazardia aedis USNM 41457]
MNNLQEQILESAINNRNLQNHDDAIFQLSFLKHEYRDFIQGVFYYESNNIPKALSLFQTYETITAKYYEALCLKRQRKFSKAIAILICIIEDQADFEYPVSENVKEGINLLIRQFLLKDYSPVHLLIAECYTLNYNRCKAIPHYFESFKIVPTITGFNNLLMENYKFNLKPLSHNLLLEVDRKQLKRIGKFPSYIENENVSCKERPNLMQAVFNENIECLSLKKDLKTNFDEKKQDVFSKNKIKKP